MFNSERKQEEKVEQGEMMVAEGQTVFRTFCWFFLEFREKDMETGYRKHQAIHNQNILMKAMIVYGIIAFVVFLTLVPSALNHSGPWLWLLFVLLVGILYCIAIYIHRNPTESNLASWPVLQLLLYIGGAVTLLGSSIVYKEYRINNYFHLALSTVFFMAPQPACICNFFVGLGYVLHVRVRSGWEDSCDGFAQATPYTEMDIVGFWIVVSSFTIVTDRLRRIDYARHAMRLRQLDHVEFPGVWMDLKGHITRWSVGMAKLTGVPESIAEGRPLSDFVDKINPSSDARDSEQRLHSAITGTARGTLKSQGNEKMPVLITTYPQWDHWSSLSGHEVHITDLRQERSAWHMHGIEDTAWAFVSSLNREIQKATSRTETKEEAESCKKASEIMLSCMSKSLPPSVFEKVLLQGSSKQSDAATSNHNSQADQGGDDAVHHSSSPPFSPNGDSDGDCVGLVTSIPKVPVSSTGATSIGTGGNDSVSRVEDTFEPPVSRQWPQHRPPADAVSALMRLVDESISFRRSGIERHHVGDESMLASFHCSLFSSRQGSLAPSGTATPHGFINGMESLGFHRDGRPVVKTPKGLRMACVQIEQMLSLEMMVDDEFVDRERHNLGYFIGSDPEGWNDDVVSMTPEGKASQLPSPLHRVGNAQLLSAGPGAGVVTPPSAGNAAPATLTMKMPGEVMSPHAHSSTKKDPVSAHSAIDEDSTMPGMTDTAVCEVRAKDAAIMLEENGIDSKHGHKEVLQSMFEAGAVCEIVNVLDPDWEPGSETPQHRRKLRIFIPMK